MKLGTFILFVLSLSIMACAHQSENRSELAMLEKLKKLGFDQGDYALRDGRFEKRDFILPYSASSKRIKRINLLISNLKRGDSFSKLLDFAEPDIIIFDYGTDKIGKSENLVGVKVSYIEQQNTRAGSVTDMNLRGVYLIFDNNLRFLEVRNTFLECYLIGR